MDSSVPTGKDQVTTSLVPHPVAPQQSLYVPRPYGLEAPEDPDSEVGLFEYWAIIRRNSRTILLAGLAGLILGFCIGIPMKRIYRASTTIEVLPMNENFLNLKDTNPVNINMDSDVSEEETQAALLSSATMQKRVAATLDPAASAGAKAHPSPSVSGWRTLFHLGRSAPVRARTLSIAKTASTLKVKANSHTRLIEATIDSADPQLAADYLNTLSSEFVQQNQEYRLLTTEHTGDWLSHELRDARDKLRQSEDALQNYARSSGLVFTSESVNVATERLQQYQQSLSAATADRIAKQSLYELAQKSAPDSLADVLNDGSLRETQSKIDDLKRQIANLRTFYSPEYTKVRRLDAELQSLQTAFNRQRDEILERIRTDYQEAVRKERLLSSTYETQTREVTGQGEKSIQYNILKREVDSNRQLYDAMLQQAKQAAISSAMRASNVRVVDPAEVPAVPVSPSFKLNSIIGMLGGLVLSTFVVLVRDQSDSTLRSPGDIRHWAELSEIGAIPNALASRKSYYRDYGSGQRQKLKSDPGRRSIEGMLGGSLELSAWQQEPGLMAESFRSALTSLLFVGEHGSRPRVLVFTSAHPMEGKTTAVSNLAIAASEIRLKVLIIDADLRRPRMHQRFNLSNDRGLTDLLQDSATENLTGFVQQTSIPNLDVLTAGSDTQTAAHLLHSPNLANLIEKFRQEYDMVLIDTPPMLQMTDARIIGRHSDAVVLVARAGQTTRESLLAAKERFEEDRIRVLGSVLNDWNPSRAPKPYYVANRKRSFGFMRSSES